MKIEIMGFCISYLYTFKDLITNNWVKVVIPDLLVAPNIRRVNELGERMKGTDRVSITFLLTSHDSLRSTVSPHTHSPSLLSSCHSLRSFHSGHTKEEWVSVAPCGESRVMMVWGHSLSLSCGPSWRTGRGLTHGHAARLFGLTSWWTGWQVHRRDPFVTLPSDPFYHSL